MNDEMKLALASLQEQIQMDLLCLLDGKSQRLQDNACQIVVDRCKEFENKFKENQ